MYIKRLVMDQFRCFEHVDVSFNYPGRDYIDHQAKPVHPNIHLLVGDNGSGKTSVLRAIAVGVLGTVLPGAGFRAYRLVRATSEVGGAESDIRVHVEVDPDERFRGTEGFDYLFRTVLKRFPSGDQVKAESTHLYAGAGPLPTPESLHQSDVPEFFLCGYGSSRRSEDPATYDEAGRVKARSPRYQRVASLFEESYTLTAFSAWLLRLTSANGKAHHHWDEVASLLKRLLANTDIEWTSGFIDGEAIFLIKSDQVKVPFSALSDGYRSFLALLGDLLKHLVEATPEGRRIAEATGVVLVDEVDLLLHPSWQRRLLSELSETFPLLQFIVTTHSPILAASVPRESVFIVGRQHGSAEIDWPDKDYYGRTVDEVLTGDIFGLETTVSPELQEQREAEDERRIALARALMQNPNTETTDAYLEELTKKWFE